jgi:hypothetical protein
MKTSIYTITVLMVFYLSTSNLEAQRRRDVNSGTTRESDSRTTSPKDPASVTQERRSGESKGTDVSRRTVVVKKNKEARRYPRKDVVVVTPRPERSFREIHHDHRQIRYNDVDYSYYEGRYYRCNHDEYILVPPPHGIRVSFIPEGVLTIMVQGIPYFYYGGVYYRENTVYREYEVVAPPMGAIVPDLPEYDVKAVVINSQTLLEYDNVLYKPIATQWGVQYKVIGVLDDNIY